MQHDSMSSPVQTLMMCIDDTIEAWFPNDDDGSCMARVLTYMWPQTHNSTALGFPGIGGQALTQAMTVAVRGVDSAIRVYHGGKFAYEVANPASEFLKRFMGQALPGKQEFERRRKEFEIPAEQTPSQP
jgi:hypothetical protein